MDAIIIFTVIGVIGGIGVFISDEFDLEGLPVIFGLVFVVGLVGLFISLGCMSEKEAKQIESSTYTTQEEVRINIATMEYDSTTSYSGVFVFVIGTIKENNQEYLVYMKKLSSNSYRKARLKIYDWECITIIEDDSQEPNIKYYIETRRDNITREILSKKDTDPRTKYIITVPKGTITKQFTF